MLRHGDTTGVFQLESAGMRRYLHELKPTELEDIIAMVSLYRRDRWSLSPSFIKRKYGKEKITYLHPSLEPILKNTYGIGIYQEQMMRIARIWPDSLWLKPTFCAKPLGKNQKLLDEQKERLIQGMIKIIFRRKPPRKFGNCFRRSHATDSIVRTRLAMP